MRVMTRNGMRWIGKGTDDGKGQGWERLKAVGISVR